MTQTVSYTSGQHTALVGPGCVLLLADGGRAEVSRRLWPLVAAGAELDELLESLAMDGLRSMGSFALVHGTRVVIRGPLEVAVVVSGRALTAQGVATWAEHTVEAGDALQVGPAPPPEVEVLPLVAGVVRASSLVLGAELASQVRAVPLGELGRPAAAAAPSAHPPAHAAPAPTTTAALPVPSTRDVPPAVRPLGDPLEALAAEGSPPAGGEALPAEEAPPEGQAAPEGGVSDLTMIPESTVAPTPLTLPATPVPPPAPAGRGPATRAMPIVDSVPGPAGAGVGPSAPTPVAAADDVYDHLFGATVSRSIEDAAVRAPEQAEEDSPRPAATPTPDTDHDGSTILSSDLATIRSAGPTDPGPETSQPVVQGVRCPSGHANAPHSPICRRCGAVVRDQDAQPLPRPSLGRLRVSDGTVVGLDRTVLVGRTPSAGRFSKEGPPHLLRVDSPQQDISRTHVEVRLDEWDVLVLDRSTNGTRLVRPGQDPQLLHRDEPVPVLPGCVLELGDGVTLTFEVEPV